MTTQEPGLLYLLRTFPELSETFVLREMQALRAAGIPVSVLAIGPGSHASLVLESEGRDGRLPPFRYLGRPSGIPSGLSGLSDRSEGDASRGSMLSSGARADSAVTLESDGGAHSRPTRSSPSSGSPVPGVAAPGSYRSLAAELARDVASLGGHPRRTARALRLAVYARRAAALVPPGVGRLHAHFANDAAALARYVSALTGIPYRVTAHAYDLYQDPFLLGANLAGAQRVYTVARANLEALQARAQAEGWDLARVSVLRCGIDLADFPYRDPAPPARPARLLSVSRLVPKKGIQTLLEAVARLGAQAGAPSADPGAPDVHLTIAGDGPQAEEIARRAAAPDLAGRVTRLGAVPPARVRELMRGSDLFVLAARIAEDGDRDGLPVSLIEAMALGVPVLATAVAGIPELVSPQTGWLVPTAGADDPARVAAAVTDALAVPHEKRLQRSRVARRRIESEFDLALQVSALRT